MRRGSYALAAAALVLALAGCGSSQAESIPDAARAVSWQSIAPSPLTPRSGAVAAWTGSVALFLGGDDSDPCPPSADCAAGPPTRDGAAYDPQTDQWRIVPSAPEPILTYSPHQMIDGTVYLWGVTHLLGYSPATSTWQTFPAPPNTAEVHGAPLARLGDGLAVMLPQRKDGDRSGVLLDPGSGSWTHLPDDPLGATFDRSAVTVPAGVVLLAHDLVAQPNSETPSVVRAALLDATTMTWQQLPDSDILGGGIAGWSGSHVVIASLGGADGGEVNNWGRTVPNGGTLDLAAGAWSHFVDPPDISYEAMRDGRLWPVAAAGGRLFATDGYVYDDGSGTWTPIPPPAGGPQRPGDAAWAGDRLIVVGGLESDDTDGHGGYAPQRSTGAWMATMGS